MSVTRIATLDGESTDVSEFDDVSFFTHETIIVHSGVGSYEMNGVSGGFKLATPFVDRLVVQYWLFVEMANVNQADVQPGLFTLYDATLDETFSRGIVLNLRSFLLNLYMGGEIVSSVSANTLGLALNQWNHIFVFIDRSNDNLKFYLNGDLIFNVAGIGNYYGIGLMTRNSGLHSSFFNSYIDDITVDDITGESNIFLPLKKFVTKYPNSVGINTQFTPNTGTNHEAVDEINSDADVTFNKTAIAALRDTFQFNSISAIQGYTPTKVRLKSFARKTKPTTSPTLRNHAYNGLTYQSGSYHLFSNLDWNRVVTELLLDNDGNPWTLASINSYQYGYESGGTF